MSDQETTNEPDPQEPEENLIQSLKEAIECHAPDDELREERQSFYDGLKEVSGSNYAAVLKAILGGLVFWSPEVLQEEREEERQEIEELKRRRKEEAREHKRVEQQIDTLRDSPLVDKDQLALLFIKLKKLLTPEEIERLDHASRPGRRRDERYNILVGGTRYETGEIVIPGLVGLFLEVDNTLIKACEVTSEVFRCFFDEEREADAIKGHYHRLNKPQSN